MALRLRPGTRIVASMSLVQKYLAQTAGIAVTAGVMLGFDLDPGAAGPVAIGAGLFAVGAATALLRALARR